MLNEKYYKSFIEFWIPIYKKQIFKAKLLKNIDLLMEIQKNIWMNWNLTKGQKQEILKILEIKKIKF